MKLDNKGRIAIVIGAILLIIISGIGLMKEIFSKKTTTKEEVIFSYQMSPVTDYTVTLIPNSYFASNELPSGRSYVKNYIDKINVLFQEEFQSSEAVQINGSYQIKSKVSAITSSSEELWSIEEKLSDEIAIKEEGTSAIIKHENSIDLSKIEEQYANASMDLGITLTFTLTVTMEGVMEVTSPSGNYTVPINTNINMPLFSNLFTITADNSNVQTDQITQQMNQTIEVSKGKIVMCSLGILSGIAILVSSIRFIKPYTEEELKLKRKLKLISDNKGRLVELMTLPKVETEQSYEIRSMDALIRVSETLNRPIFYVPDEEKMEVECIFFVVDGKDSYFYIFG